MLMGKFVKHKDFRYPDKAAYNYVLDYFKEHNVSIDKMAKEAFEHQSLHHTSATVKEFKDEIYKTLHKRDVLSHILVGINLDNSAEQGALDEPLQSIIANDAGAFSPDETNAITISSMYSGIAVTNFGYRDVEKRGIAKDLDEDTNHINVFLDDIVSAIIGTAEASVAHKYDF